MKMSRRIFLGGMGAALGSSRLKLTMAEPGSVSGLDGPPVFIHMFLRGGMDGLSFMPPRTGANYSNYEAMRPNIRIRPSANAPG